MDKYTKAVLTVIAFYALALPVKAEEKVWYCEMTGFANTTMSGEKTFKLGKFKMKVTQQNIEFGSGGYFDKAVYPIKFYGNSNMWSVSDSFTTIGFKDGTFNYGSATYEDAVAISARCDDF